MTPPPVPPRFLGDFHPKHPPHGLPPDEFYYCMPFLKSPIPPPSIDVLFDKLNPAFLPRGLKKTQIAASIFTSVLVRLFRHSPSYVVISLILPFYFCSVHK